MSATQRQRRHAQPKLTVEDKLLVALERLFEKGVGFSTLTIEQLAKEAGIARATFYLHFADKGELVARLMGRLTLEVVGSAGDWFQAKGRPGPQTVEHALSGIIKTFRKHHAILSAVEATKGQDETVARLFQEMMDRLCEQSRQALAKLPPDSLRPEVSPDLLADVLTWSVEQYCVRVVGHCDDGQIEDLIRTFTHICNSAMFSSAARVVER